MTTKSTHNNLITRKGENLIANDRNILQNKEI